MSSRDKHDIAKQFDLPERKSKIATLLKETDVYCICRSTDSTRFMIACDHCEEWYHGDCINITESDAKYIKQYFCPPCMERDPTLEIEYKKAKTSSSRKDKSKPGSSDKRTESKKGGGRPSKGSWEASSSSYNKSQLRCGSCSGCLQVVDCYRCDACIKTAKYGDKSGKVCRKRRCVGLVDSDYEAEDVKPSVHQTAEKKRLDLSEEEEESWLPSPTKVKKQASTQQKRGKRQPRGAKDKGARSSRRKTRGKRDSSTSNSEPTYEDSDSDEEVQCNNLDCINPTQKGSKYCSQECCVTLALERIYRILPGRIQEWNLTSSVAEEHNRKDLEEVRRKQMETKNRISELERKRADLDRHVENVQLLTIDPDAEDDEPEEEGLMHCITCGHEIAVKSCLKHMERCYNKYESQTSFGSIYKTKLEGTPIFCDFYNPNNGTYCKRLSVLCPEHSKEPKIGDTEVCGSPLVNDLAEAAEQFCRRPKKNCNKHFSWEKLRRAEVDMERVRYWLKLDELFEQERQIRVAMSNRGGVMGLLLHSTFDHELRNRIQSQIQDGKSQQQQQKQKKSASSGEEDISDEEDEELARE